MKGTEILRFFPAPEGAVKIVPAAGATKFDVFEDVQGKTRKMAPIISGGTQVVGDDGEMSVLKVRKEDVPNLVSALRWRVDLGGGDINFTTQRSKRDAHGQYVTIEQTGDIFDIFVPGRFDPSPTISDISSIIEEHSLLGKMFPNRVDIFKQKIGANALTEILILALLESQNVKLPEWIERVLALRKESREVKGATGDFGWE